MIRATLLCAVLLTAAQPVMAQPEGARPVQITVRAEPQEDGAKVVRWKAEVYHRGAQTRFHEIDLVPDFSASEGRLVPLSATETDEAFQLNIQFDAADYYPPGAAYGFVRIELTSEIELDGLEGPQVEELGLPFWIVLRLWHPTAGRQEATVTMPILRRSTAEARRYLRFFRDDSLVDQQKRFFVSMQLADVYAYTRGRIFLPYLAEVLEPHMAESIERMTSLGAPLSYVIVPDGKVSGYPRLPDHRFERLDAAIREATTFWQSDTARLTSAGGRLRLADPSGGCDASLSLLDYYRRHMQGLTGAAARADGSLLPLFRPCRN